MLSSPGKRRYLALLKSQSPPVKTKTFLITIAVKNKQSFCALRPVCLYLYTYFFKLLWHSFISASGFKIYCFDLVEGCSYCTTMKPEKHVFSHQAVSFQVCLTLLVELMHLLCTRKHQFITSVLLLKVNFCSVGLNCCKSSRVES